MRGVSLISVLVAMALLGVLLLGIISAMSLMNKSERGFRQGSEITLLVEEVHTLLRDREACKKTLLNLDPDPGPTNVPAIKNSANDNIFLPGQAYGAGKVITLDTITVGNYEANTSIPTEGNAELHLNFSKTGSLGPNTSKRKIRIFARLDGTTGQIIYCQALGDSELWKVSPANSTNIFYDTGNVEIGSVASPATLEVNDTIRAVFYGALSDRAKKTSIKKLEENLAKLFQFSGVSFRWKKNSGVSTPHGKDKSLGFIAQEVEKTFPELVRGEEGNKMVNYSGLIPVLWEAVKELKEGSDFKDQMNEEKIKKLENEIQKLRAELLLLKNEEEASK